MQSQSMHTPPFPFMSKRKLPPSPEIRRQHPSSPTPLPKPISSSLPSLSSRNRSSAASNSSPFLALPTAKRGPFWSQKGMVPFVDWITTPENHAALHRRKTSSASSSPSSSSVETLSQAVERLRSYVKARSGVRWLPSQIKSKLQYAQKRYDEAKALSESEGSIKSMDQATLRSKMLELCPFYEQFHAVYGGTPLPPAAPAEHSSMISLSPSSSLSSPSLTSLTPAPFQLSSSSFYSQAASAGDYTSPQEARPARTFSHPRQPSPSPLGDGSSSRRYEEMDIHPLEEYQSPQADRDAGDEEGEEETRDPSPEEPEETRDPSPEEGSVREPSGATFEMESVQGMTSDHGGQGSGYGNAPEREADRERSVALRTGDKGKGSSKRHRASWGGRYSHHDYEDNDTHMDEFKAFDSPTAAAGRILWIEQDKERMRQLVRKEQMLEERESSWALRMLQQQEQHQAMLLKREEEADLRLKRRYEELEEERQQVRAMQQELATRQREFYKERESWLAGYAVVQADAAKAAALYHAQN